MKVHVHVGQGLPLDFPGGSTTVMRNLALAQSQLRAHQVYVFANVRLVKQDIYLIEDKNFVRISKFYSQENQIIHFHFSLTMLIFLIRYPKTIFSKKIFHFHGPWNEESKFQGDNSIKVSFKKLIEKQCLRIANFIICATESFSNIAGNYYNGVSKKVFVIPLGVDLDQFRLISLSKLKDYVFENDFPTLGTLRRLVPRMGLEVLIKAVAKIGSVNLLIAGEGIDKSKLEALVNELGLNDRVKFLGRITESEKVIFYNSIDLMVVPSLALEGFGLVVLEAMACGTPVIASKIDGLNESMGPFKDSNMFQSNNVDALKDKIIQLLSNKSALELNPYLLYAQTMSWNKVAVETDSLICSN